jgi:uncharacterized membrane protein
MTYKGGPNVGHNDRIGHARTHGPFILILVLLFIAGPFLPCLFSTAPVMAAVVADPKIDENGLMWDVAVKVTNNDLDDQNPSVRLDPFGNANIVYQQSGMDLMRAKVTPPAKVVMSDKRLQTGYIPTQYQIKNESTPQPTRFFDIGPEGNLHLVWTEAGLLDNKYQRFDPEGLPQTGVIPMNQVTDLSRLPYLGVGPNGRAYIAFENEGTAWVQMTYVDLEGYLRAATLIGRPGENVAFAVGPDGNLHLFYRSLGADASLFHVKLDADRKTLVPNRLLFSNKSAIANPYSSMPSVAITPNGHVHLVMSDTTIAPHPIYYIELDENGTPLMDFVKVAEGAYNFGDIVADPDKGAYVAWDNVADGEVHYRHIQDGIVSKELVLTSSGGKARHPQLCTDRLRGDLHLVYIDGTDGDGEVYYKYANAFRIGMDIPELGSALSVHPGAGPLGLNVTVSDIGEIPMLVKFNYSVDYHGLQNHNWSFTFPTVETNIGPGKTTQSLAILQPPDRGDPGEGIDITIKATPVKDPAKAQTLSFRSTLVVKHDISLSGPLRWPLMNKTQQIALSLANDGDLEETVDLNLDGGLPDWDLALNITTIQVPPGVSAALKLLVTLPNSEAPDQVSIVLVHAKTRSSPAAHEALTISLVSYPSVFPLIDNSTIELEVAPGGTGTASTGLGNVGTYDGVFGISAYILSGTDSWIMQLKAPTVTVHPGQKVPIGIDVTAPDHARYGPGLVVDLVASEIHGKAQVTLRVEVKVSKVTQVTVSGGKNATVLPGETANFPLTIQNRGNSEQGLELSVLPVPSGWKWHFGQEAGLSMITLPPYATRSLELFVTPPVNASPMTKSIEATVSGDGGVHKVVSLLTIRPVFGVLVDAAIPLVKAPLDSEASFELMVTNNGTALEEFVLLFGELPTGVTARFVANNVTVTSIVVPVHSSKMVRLVLTLPDRLNASDFDVWAGARSSKAGTSGTDLVVELRLPDLRVKDVVFNDKGLKDGDVRNVTVIVANSGDGDVKGVVVDLNGQQKTLDISASSQAQVLFKVKFHSDDKTLVVVVDPQNKIQERREDNNDFMVQIKVQAKSAIPGFEAPLVGTALGLVFVNLFYSNNKFRRFDQ